MDRSQPGTPLLVGNPPQNQDTHSSSVHAIPRKPVPKANAQHTPEAGEVRDSEGGKFNNVGYSSVPGSPQQKSNGSMAGRLRHITLICVLLVLPLCGITTALLVVVYQNRLPHSRLASSQPCSGLVVDYGASQLTSLSTWISTIATLLAPAFMALLSYPVAKSMTQRHDIGHVHQKLPSTYQTGLLVELLGGSLISLWGSLSYMLSRRRARVSALLYFSYAGLLCGVLFGILTQLADFWLHRATDSILYTASQPLSEAQYGRTLSSYCQDYYATNGASRTQCTGVRINGTELNLPCSVDCGEYDLYPTGFEQGFLLANSLPATNSLAVTKVSNEVDFDGAGTIVALLPSNVDSDVTWTAKTVGVGTRCEYLFNKCDTQVDPAGAIFNCGTQVPPIGYDGSDPIPFNSSNLDARVFQYGLSTLLQPGKSDPLVFQNPWIFGLAMQLFGIVNGKNLPDNLPSGDETIFTIVRCNTTTYDVQYSVGDQNRNTTSSNSSVPVIVERLERSSGNVHDTVHGHIIHSQKTREYLERAMLASIFSTKIDGEVLPRFEQEYGKMALSFAAASFEGIPTTQRNIVEQRVVSCVQRAPLWTLVGLVGVYIILAIVLAMVAIIASTGNNVRSAQSQLSVAGLAAKAFNEKGLQQGHRSVRSMEEFFDERTPEKYAKDLEGHGKRKYDAKRVGFKVNKAGRWEFDVVAGGSDRSSFDKRSWASDDPKRWSGP